MKTLGLAGYATHLVSADSMAWSLRARHQGRRDGRSWCGSPTHANCANCLAFATAWRADLLAKLAGEPTANATARSRDHGVVPA